MAAPVEHNPNPDSAEPLVSVAAVTAVGAAVVGLLVAFGLDLTDAQQKGILGVLAALAPVVVAAWGRRKVYSPATVARLMRR